MSETGPAVSDEPRVAALQAVLDGEYAAIYAYGLVGAALSDQTPALAALAVHRSRRTQVRDLIRDLGAVPAPAAIAYDPPSAIADEAGAVALAAYVEDRLALVWCDVVLRVPAGDPLRTTAALAAQESATRCTVWSGRTAAFPGLLSP